MVLKIFCLKMHSVNYSQINILNVIFCIYCYTIEVNIQNTANAVLAQPPNYAETILRINYPYDIRLYNPQMSAIKTDILILLLALVT